MPYSTITDSRRGLALPRRRPSLVISHSHSSSTATSIILPADGTLTSIPKDRYKDYRVVDLAAKGVNLGAGQSRLSSSARTLRGWKLPRVPLHQRNLFYMLSLLVTAGVAIACHHLYLALFDGRPAGSQYWVKGGRNAFAYAVRALLAGSVSVALLDVTWNYVHRKDIALKHLDIIFSLPSLFYGARFLFSSAPRNLPVILLFVLFIQAFALVPVMTPNVLSVVPAPTRPANLSVPTINMSLVPMDASVTYYNQLSGPLYISPSTQFLRLAQQTYTSASPPALDVPSGCQSSCAYAVQFDGPYLQCSDIDSSSIDDMDPFSPQVPPQGTISLPAWRQMIFGVNTTFISASEWNLHGLPLFNATSNLNVAATTPADDITLTVAYTTARVYCTNGSDIIDNYRCSYIAEEPRGSICRFKSATYRVDVQFADHTQSTTSRLLTIGDPLVFSSAELSASNEPSYLASLSARALADAFRLSIMGSIYGSGLRPLPPATISGTSIQYTSLFSFAQPGPDGLAYAFAPAVQNVSQGLTDLSTNMTLSLMSKSAGFDTIRTTVAASVAPYSNVWKYDRQLFFIVYIVAIVVASLCDLVGRRYMRSNDEPGSMAFSRIIAATRAPGLEQIVEADRREAKYAKLRYGLVEGADGRHVHGFAVVETDGVANISS